ncbi:hypothetical protein P9112_011828 [Eukaryota sp. TZLM1-RC]
MTLPSIILKIQLFFSKFLRLAISFLDLNFKLHSLINVIRTDAVKCILKHDLRNESFENLRDLLFRLKELLPRYHLPYPEFYTYNKQFSSSRPDDLASNCSQPPSRFSSCRSSHQHRPKSNRNSPYKLSRTISISFSPSTTSANLLARRSPEIISCFCKKPAHMINDCADRQCRVSQ